MFDAPDHADAHRGMQLALEFVDWLGSLGWLLLFLFYFLLLSRKSYPVWWSFGAFCLGPNLLLYIALLFMPKRHSSMAAMSNAVPLEANERLRLSASLLKDSFVCRSCHSLLNYGVSECRECGELYRYVDGKPLVSDSTHQRRG